MKSLYFIYFLSALDTPIIIFQSNLKNFYKPAGDIAVQYSSI